MHLPFSQNINFKKAKINKKKLGCFNGIQKNTFLCFSHQQTVLPTFDQPILGKLKSNELKIKYTYIKYSKYKAQYVCLKQQ